MSEYPTQQRADQLMQVTKPQHRYLSLQELAFAPIPTLAARMAADPTQDWT